jgi:hypothetical protein
MQTETIENSSCGCGTSNAPVAGQAPRPSRTRGWLATGSLAASCGLACAAVALSAALWPLAALAAVFGVYGFVRNRGCGIGSTGDASAAPRLDAAGRRARKQRGAQLGFLAGVLAAVAYCDFAFLWPLAGVALWFGASFWVAGVTGYSGCPELGAIPSWLLRREIATTCPPLDSRLTGDPN